MRKCCELLVPQTCKDSFILLSAFLCLHLFSAFTPSSSRHPFFYKIFWFLDFTFEHRGISLCIFVSHKAKIFKYIFIVFLHLVLHLGLLYFYMCFRTHFVNKYVDLCIIIVLNVTLSSMCVVSAIVTFQTDQIRQRCEQQKWASAQLTLGVPSTGDQLKHKRRTHQECKAAVQNSYITFSYISVSTWEILKTDKDKWMYCNSPNLLQLCLFKVWFSN